MTFRTHPGISAAAVVGSGRRGVAWLDLAQGLSGAVLVLFMWVHMFLVSSILLGKDAMLWVTHMFEGVHVFGKAYPGLVSAVAAVIFLLVVYWGVKGDFIDFWDAFLWLVAFVFIELNVFEWRAEEHAGVTEKPGG